MRNDLTITETDIIEARRRRRMLAAGAAVTVALALGLAGCSSSASSTSADPQPTTTVSSSAAADDDDDDDDDTSGSSLAVTGSTFADARAVADAFIKAGGTCENPVDSGLSIATSSLDCTGPAGGIQTIAVFPTEDEAQKWYQAQTVVEVQASTTYLLGGNWAMVGDASSMNAGQTLGVRDQTIVMK
jgi:uncharacterized protein YceK